MQVSKTLTSLVAAASLVGAIGVAYAQTTGGTTQTPQQAQMGAVDGTPNNNSNMNNKTMPGQTAPMGTTATPGSNAPMGAQTDLAPQADRN